MPQVQTYRPQLRQMIDVPLGAGESPVWDEARQMLWFVDIRGPAVYGLKADGALQRFDMPAVIGCVVLARSGLLVVALQTGVHLLDPDTGALESLCDPDGSRSDSRLNDGKVGPDGHFWVGTRDEAEPQTGNGYLYRVAPDGSFTRHLAGLMSSNGLAWSPDGRRMYHSDSSGLYVQACDFDPVTGDLGHWQRLHVNSPEEGRPDGAATDSQGYYWSCGVRSGRINRMDPQGHYVEIWQTGALGCSMPCFGGPDLRRLYMTSLCLGPDDPAKAGSLYAFEAPVAGAPVARFAL